MGVWLYVHVQIIGIGLCGVFELIKETRFSHPSLCLRSLQALLDMLQGQQPEGFQTEPPDVLGKAEIICVNCVLKEETKSLLSWLICLHLYTTFCIIGQFSFFPLSESLFQLLLETTVRSTGPNDPTGQAITALSCACLFSLVVAWGDTGKILQAVSAILTNNGSHACQTIQVNNQFKWNRISYSTDTLFCCSLVHLFKTV